MGERYRRMEDQKPWRGLALKQDTGKGRRLRLTLKKCKCLTWETFVE